MWDYDVIRYLIYICPKPKYLENEIRYWETEDAFLTHFVIIIYYKIKIGKTMFSSSKNPFKSKNIHQKQIKLNKQIDI